MSIEPGRRVLYYELVEQIGKGGMGVVWRGRDTKLDREVAIKILPDDFAQNPDRLARFAREAKLLASLNHANIATIHGLEQDAGVHFLAMELVEGEDLAARIGRGAIPIEETLPLALQIASALEAAHEQGVIHRDLKPPNIKVTPEGKVKVLDFGLAKAFGPDAQDPMTSPTMSPTVTSGGTTAIGVILGTAAYMSPEQAKGRPVDRRADIWSFGVVLLEMLTGRLLFRGESVSETIAAVLMAEADLSALPANTPNEIRRLIERCLRKDPQSRLRDIGDARVVIEETLATPPEKRSVVQSTSSRSRIPVSMTILATVAGLAIGLLVGLQFVPSEPERRVQRFFLPVEAERDRQSVAAPILSPDGRSIVYVVDGKLWLRDLDQVAPRPLNETDGGRMPFWSPDGAHVGYRKDDSMWRIPVSGGQPFLISDESSQFYPASWGDNGMIVFSTLHEILEVSARGGEPKMILEKNTETEQHFHEAYHLPGGRGLLLVLHRDESYDTIALWAGGKRGILLTLEGSDIENPTYSPTGHILFTRSKSNEGLWALPFSLSSLEATGEPFLVVPRGSQASASSDGTLVYIDSRTRRDMELVWFDSEGTILGTIGQPQMKMKFPVISPDGTKVAVSGEEDKDWDIWVHDETGRKGRITFDKSREFRPRWPGDGSRVFYHQKGGSNPSIFSVDSNAGGDREFVTAGRQVSFAQDDSHMVLTRMGDGTKGDLWSLSPEGDGDAEVFLQTEADENEPKLSPDGRFLAYVSDESGDAQVYIKPFPEGSGKWQVSVEHGWHAYWSPTGDRLYYNSYGRLMEVQVSTDPVLRLGTPQVFLDPEQTTLMPWLGIDISEGGKRFVGIRNVKKDDDDEDKVEEGIHIVLNWVLDF